MSTFSIVSNRVRSSLGALLVLALFTVCAHAQQRIYFRENPPTASPQADPYDADTNPNGWRDVTGGNTGDVAVPAGGSVYFGAMNHEDPHKKSITLKLNWLSGDKNKFTNPTATGHSSGGATTAGYVSSIGNKTSIKVSWPSCPAWEHITLTNFSTTAQSIRIAPSMSPSKCYEYASSASDPSVDLQDTITLSDVLTGVPGEQVDPMRLTEIQIFPLNMPVNMGAMPTFEALPHTGNWTSEFVAVDPSGLPRPEGGVRFASDGPGIMLGDFYSCSLTTLGPCDCLYALYAFNADTGDWYDYEIVRHELPWFERFDNYSEGDSMHGVGGWKGWDNDPAFDAVVTPTQTLSPTNSVEVAGDTDLVREFEGAGAGAWAFTAWQYIPGDFQSGGGGNFAGSYFVLLNSYNDGGPYDWSVQYNFDSNDGMLKVYYGNGLNTVDRPYEPDRWVAIQAIVDLDNDWTRVYYDDDFVAEYSWIGGVLGDGTGVSNIAAVDLFAQGSSAIYYDNLRLEQIPHCRADLTWDNELDFFDVQEFLSAFSAHQSRADWTHDGVWDFFDALGYLDDFSAGCGE